MLHNLGGLTWIESSGGPLLLLSSEHLADWEGVDSSSNGHIVQATFRWNDPSVAATDYDRACDVEDYIAVIPVANGTGLVLNQEPMPTAWWPHDDQIGGLLIRWLQGDPETDVLELLAHLPNLGWESGHITFTVGSSSLYLFDAASPGNELDEHLTIALRAGAYRITTALYEPDNRTSLILHRFTQFA
jgi:hypothetical protein